MSLTHESKALQSRLETEQNAIQRMEAVQALVDRFPSGEMAPGEGPTLQVSTHRLSLITSLCDTQNAFKMGQYVFFVSVVHIVIVWLLFFLSLGVCKNF